MERVYFANIHEFEVVFHQTYDMSTVANAEVEVHNGKTLREAIHQGKQTRRETMNAAECEGVKLRVES